MVQTGDKKIVQRRIGIRIFQLLLSSLKKNKPFIIRQLPYALANTFFFFVDFGS